MLKLMYLDAALAAIGVALILAVVACNRVPTSWPNAGDGALGSIVGGIGWIACFASCLITIAVALLNAGR